MQWYYAENGNTVGPLSADDFNRRVEAGTITAQTLVWHEGLAEWVRYASLTPAAAPAAPAGSAATSDASTVACCECGRAFPPEEVVSYEGRFVCGACKSLFFQRLQEGASVPGQLLYGGFWIRLLAKFIDGLILGTVNIVLTIIFTAASVAASESSHTGLALGVTVLLWAIELAIGAAYTTLFLGRLQATPGKMACRLRVVRSDGSRLTYGRAFGRHFAEMLSQLTLYIGYIMAASDEEKRTLHDRVCDTRVVKTQG